MNWRAVEKILVVDDNPASRELIRAILKGAGRQVLEASDGREALQMIAETEPDLVLLDLELPVLDGFAVLRQLRQDPRFAALPVIAITAYAMQGDRERALAAGFDGYLAKPIGPRVLREQVGQVLNRGRSSR